MVAFQLILHITNSQLNKYHYEDLQLLQVPVREKDIAQFQQHSKYWLMLHPDRQVRVQFQSPSPSRRHDL